MKNIRYVCDICGRDIAEFRTAEKGQSLIIQDITLSDSILLSARHYHCCHVCVEGVRKFIREATEACNKERGGIV